MQFQWKIKTKKHEEKFKFLLLNFLVMGSSYERAQGEDSLEIIKGLFL